MEKNYVVFRSIKFGPRSGFGEPSSPPGNQAVRTEATQKSLWRVAGTPHLGKLKTSADAGAVPTATLSTGVQTLYGCDTLDINSFAAATPICRSFIAPSASVSTSFPTRWTATTAFFFEYPCLSIEPTSSASPMRDG